MVVSVQFKNKKKEFVGKTYDYELVKGEKVPQKGQIIRMMDEQYNYLCYGTRVKVVDVKQVSPSAQMAIRYVEDTLDD